jgi:Phospholipase_D-nuclease N-terminal
MSKAKKIWIGVLTILPGAMFAAYGLFFFFIFFGAFSGAFDTKSNEPPPFTTYMPIMMVIFFLGFGLTTIMTIYHVIHINKSKTMSSNDKLMWMLIVILLNWLGDVIYWYMKIWKEDKNTDPTKNSFY